MRVLIVKLSSLGDVVHAMPVVHDIQSVYSNAHIEWVVEPAFAPLVRRVEGIDEVIECAQRRWRKAWWTSPVRAEWRAFRNRLTAQRYDAVIDLQGLTKSALVARMANGPSFGLANRTEGSGYELPARWLVDQAIAIEPRIHAVDRSRELVARALNYTASGSPHYGLQAHTSPAARPTVVFVHGTSRADKLWPEENWIDLGKRMTGSGFNVALPHAGAEELARAQRLAQALGHHATVWPAMSLDAMVDQMGATQGVIGVDSGLSHIAVALNLPHVQLYNFPTAWRTGPQLSHGHRHQVSLERDPTPEVDLVWATWQVVRRMGRACNGWLARSAYSNLLRLLTPGYVLRLWLRGRAEPLYRHAIGERLGRYSGDPQAGAVWVHAVSLGETRAAAALIDALRRQRPGMRLLLTHSTATGRDAGQALLREGDAQTWLPYDTPGAVQRFFAQFKPAVGVLMETEIWPNLQRGAQTAGVPMVLANARLSPKSFRQGQRLAALMRPAAESLALALAQTEDDATRLRDSGVREVVVCGNLKFDLAPDERLLARGRAWRAALARPVVMAAVTREGEEALLLAAWAGVPASQRPLLLIVPRHPQRFDEVVGLIQQAGLTLARRSQWSAHSDDLPDATARAADVWVGDSMGEMPLYYATADVALLGGSFAPLGGQNLIEAAACACPVVMGPHTFNFAQAAELSLAAGASLRVADMAEGVQRAVSLAGHAERDDYARRAVAFAAQHRGAAERMAQRISPLLSA